MILRVLLVGALSLVLASTSLADFTAGPQSSGLGQNDFFPDDEMTPWNSTISVSTSETITGFDVCINGMDHTWVGDLIVNLTHVQAGMPNTTMSLFNRVGRAGFGQGDSSNLLGDYVFSDNGNSNLDLWSEAGLSGDTYDIRPGTYRPTPVNFSGTYNSIAGTYGGQTTDGLWILTILDSDEKELGRYDSWSIKFRTQGIPEPGTTGLVLTALCGLMIRRRRK